MPGADAWHDAAHKSRSRIASDDVECGGSPPLFAVPACLSRSEESRGQTHFVGARHAVPGDIPWRNDAHPAMPDFVALASCRRYEHPRVGIGCGIATVSPSTFAGHGMPCPYEKPCTSEFDLPVALVCSLRERHKHRDAPLVLPVRVSEECNQVVLLQLNPHQDVSSREDGEQQMSLRHLRRRPERQQEP